MQQVQQQGQCESKEGGERRKRGEGEKDHGVMEGKGERERGESEKKRERIE